jgi:hypothetical protein
MEKHDFCKQILSHSDLFCPIKETQDAQLDSTLFVDPKILFWTPHAVPTIQLTSILRPTRCFAQARSSSKLYILPHNGLFDHSLKGLLFSGSILARGEGVCAKYPHAGPTVVETAADGGGITAGLGTRWATATGA